MGLPYAWKVEYFLIPTLQQRLTIGPFGLKGKPTRPKSGSKILKTHFANAVDPHAFWRRQEAHKPKKWFKDFEDPFYECSWTSGLWIGRVTHMTKKWFKRWVTAWQTASVLTYLCFFMPLCHLLISVWLYLMFLFTKLPTYLGRFIILNKIKSLHSLTKHILIVLFCHSQFIFLWASSIFFFYLFTVHNLLLRTRRMFYFLFIFWINGLNSYSGA